MYSPIVESSQLTIPTNHALTSTNPLSKKAAEEKKKERTNKRTNKSVVAPLLLAGAQRRVGGAFAAPARRLPRAPRHLGAFRWRQRGRHDRPRDSKGNSMMNEETKQAKIAERKPFTRERLIPLAKTNTIERFLCLS